MPWPLKKCWPSTEPVYTKILILLFKKNDCIAIFFIYGGERPARAALALVLDASDGALCSPVDGRWQRRHADLGELLWQLGGAIRLRLLAISVVDTTKLLPKIAAKILKTLSKKWKKKKEEFFTLASRSPNWFILTVNPWLAKNYKNIRW